MTADHFFCDTIAAALDQYGPMLRSLLGRTIEATWVAWDENEDEFFTEEPVIIRIGGHNLEIVFHNLEELSITCDTVDLSMPPQWWTDWTFHRQLRWRCNALPDLARVVGERIHDIRLNEYLLRTTVVLDRVNPENVGNKDEAWRLNGIDFCTDTGYVRVFNALDTNGLTADRLDGLEVLRFYSVKQASG